MTGGKLFRSSEEVLRCQANERIAALSMQPKSDTIPLHKGEPDFRTPGIVCKTAYEAAKSGKTGYPLPKGDIGLRKAIASDIKTFATVDIDEESVLITNGATEAIYIAMKAYLNPGDAVAILDPCYSLYSTIAQQIGVEVINVPLGPGLRPDLSLLGKRLRPNCRMLIINNPNNPVGTVLTRSELDAIADVAVEYGLMVLSDEVYDKIVFDGRQNTSALAVEKLANRTILVNSFSKTYAMAGWRIGYIVMPREKIQSAFLIHLNLTNGVNSITQEAALKALSFGEKLWGPMVADYEKRRNLVCDELKKIGSIEFMKPEGTFYVFCKFNLEYTSGEITNRLLDGGVAVRNGAEFGTRGEGYFRISFCQDKETIKVGLARIAKAL